MEKLTFQNHFKFGYNGEYFNQRKSPKDLWNVEYGRCKRDPYNFRNECIKAAKLIREDNDKKIFILMSGGVDSEIVVRSFIDAGIPITSIIGRYNHDLNQHDIRYAIEFCKAYGVDFEIVDIDIYEFWRTKLQNYAAKTMCVSPQLPVIMYISDQVDGYTIIGSGETFLVRDDDGQTWSLWEKEKIASWYRHYIVNNKEGAPGFFQYTPEIMLSYVTDTGIVDILEDPSYSSSYYAKLNVYNKYWNLKQREIFTGFENYGKLDYQVYRPFLEKEFGDSDQIVKTEYNKLIDKLSPIKCYRIPKDEIMKYHHLYVEENMTLKRTPYQDHTSLTNYYVAYINNKIVGFTAMDFFEDFSGVYVHGAYTFPEFRGQGINRELWNFKMNDLKEFPDMIIHSINPGWLNDAKAQQEMLERKGFKHTDNRPDGAPVMTCKVKDLKYGT